MRNYLVAIPDAVDPQRIDMAAIDAALRSSGLAFDGVGIMRKDYLGNDIPPALFIAAAETDPTAAAAALDWAMLQIADAP